MAAYSYDNASQLTALTYSNGSTSVGGLTYNYDLAGRRISAGGSLAAVNLPAAVSSAVYNANNQLTSWGAISPSYDANGNLTNDGVHLYGWDASSRLTQIDSGVTASFYYDALGRRTSKTVQGGQTGFLYDGWNPVQELSGTTATANLLSGGIDEYFQRTDASGTRDLLTDALGSTLALTDSTGAVQTNYSYEPFGANTATGTATSNSFAYTGRELDANGLYFYRARYYSPTFGRFISEDPIGIGGGLNLYQYVGDDPTNLSDSLGLSPLVGRNCFKHCIEVFKQVIPGFTLNKWENVAANTPIIFPRDPGFSQFTQADVVGGSDTTPLNQILPYGDPAVTIHGPWGAAILLGPNALTNGVSVDAVLVHELIHGYTNWSDQDVFNNFSHSGLVHRNPGTNDISKWIDTGCRSTP